MIGNTLLEKIIRESKEEWATERRRVALIIRPKKTSEE